MRKFFGIFPDYLNLETDFSYISIPSLQFTNQLTRTEIINTRHRLIERFLLRGTVRVTRGSVIKGKLGHFPLFFGVVHSLFYKDGGYTPNLCMKIYRR